jgi:prepilin signal peptidase PulO-like enzyme (type II secretory pathway)
VLLSLFLAYLLAAGWVVWLLLLKKVKLGQYVPFAPALALGGVITLFWGDRIVGWYLGWFL